MGSVKFFDTTDPFGLADWEVQTGPNPNLTKQRASALNRFGNEFARAQYGAQEACSFTYVAKKFTGTLTVPNVGLVSGGYHLDNWSVSYSQTGYPTLTLSCHRHIDGTEDSNCRQYAPTFSVPARAIGVPTSISGKTEGTVFALADSATVGIRSMTLSVALNHVDEMDNEGGHLAGDNYDGSETISVDFTGDIDSSDYTLHAEWTDDSLNKSNGNTTATTSSLTASHHVAHVEGTGTP